MKKSPASLRRLDHQVFFMARDAFERETILAAISTIRSISMAARALGVERSYLYKKMKALGIQAPCRRKSSEVADEMDNP